MTDCYDGSDEFLTLCRKTNKNFPSLFMLYACVCYALLHSQHVHKVMFDAFKTERNVTQSLVSVTTSLTVQMVVMRWTNTAEVKHTLHKLLLSSENKH